MTKLGNFTCEQLKTKVASLERGQELLSFGMHPVVSLDMQTIDCVAELLKHIGDRLERAGLDEATVKELMTTCINPTDLLASGAKILNNKFRTDFGVESKTIVLIDEHDKPFRNRNLSDDDTNAKDSNSILSALVKLFGLGKVDGTGISLLILCGLTRMVGSGLSILNNRVDISHESKYHGLCGISALEFINSCNGELDQYAKDNYEGMSLEVVVRTIFTPKWDGFRFGLDKNVGWLDPRSPDGALLL